MVSFLFGKINYAYVFPLSCFYLLKWVNLCARYLLATNDQYCLLQSDEMKIELWTQKVQTLFCVVLSKDGKTKNYSTRFFVDYYLSSYVFGDPSWYDAITFKVTTFMNIHEMMQFKWLLTSNLCLWILIGIIFLSMLPWCVCVV